MDVHLRRHRLPALHLPGRGFHPLFRTSHADVAGHCLRGGIRYLCKLHLPVLRTAAAETHRGQHVQLLPAGDCLFRSGAVGHGPLRLDENPFRPAGLHGRASGHQNRKKDRRSGAVNNRELQKTAFYSHAGMNTLV